jgi:hypothetical protein
MHDLREQIRDLVDSGADPVSAQEVWASQRSPRTGRLRRPAPFRFRRTIKYAVTAAAILALVVVGLILVPSDTRLNTPAASAAAVLKKAAKEAAAEPALVPGPGQFLYVRMLDGSIEGIGSPPDSRVERFYAQELIQVWSAPGAQGVNTSEVVGVPRFVSGADRAAWQADGAKPLESGFSGGGETTYFDVADLPTDPSEMAAYFAKQSYLPVDAAHGRDAVWEFGTALDFLENGASSTQRAALLRFMATIPGVADQGSATTLGTDETGTLLSIAADSPAGTALQAIFDVSTSQLLEVRTVVTDSAERLTPTSSQVITGQEMAPLQPGQVEGYSDFLFDGIASSTHAVPAGAPALPAVWPYGSGREPAPGSVYP